MSRWWLPQSMEVVLLVLAAGFAVLALALARSGPSGNRSRRMAWMGCASCLGLVLARAWVMEPFHVPSASMAPTLLEGDVVLVEKFPYQLSWPLGESRMLRTGMPRLGDVVVFTLPADPAVRYVKRVMGRPGDDVVVLDGTWYVNGQEVAATPAGFFHDIRGSREAIGRRMLSHRAAAASFVTLDPGTHVPFAAHWLVPADRVFVLGDNRGLSRDSRDFGFVPMALVSGRARWTLFNVRGMDRWFRPL